MSPLILALLLILTSSYETESQNKGWIYDITFGHKTAYVEMNFVLEYAIKGYKGTFDESDLTLFEISTKDGLHIKLDKHGAFADIKCNMIFSEIYYEFNDCRVSIQPQSVKIQTDLSIKHHYKFNTNTKYEFTGKASYTHQGQSDGTHLEFNLFYLMIENKGYTETCHVNDENIAETYIGPNYIYPCNLKSSRYQADIETREDSQPLGICCCMNVNNAEKTHVDAKHECEFIFHARDCASNSPQQCLAKLPAEYTKSALCKECNMKF
ncbi:hypothetical protein RF11_07924 [Thelohanellus kitauei]|uniref:Uncharacterized protein n=1 Tax=Thelohanellus kitauei TaxID=669202 RepID=A0A0C2JAC2_THEKT|nr:hypothetical protein RF11_07924 [Thelohanellus kitauei]